MPISAADLEAAIRAAMPVTYLEIEDTSNGCGENYSVFVVSQVCMRCPSGSRSSGPSSNGTSGTSRPAMQAFEGKNTLARHRFSECTSWKAYLTEIA
ncbi:hypothetical protein C8Q70DRAFT_343226 [Cubamyces menziesii]|nr:hypothetical protein C8Q70DRAFT_343226 [Cubamyces menziesii]